MKIKHLEERPMKKVQSRRRHILHVPIESFTVLQKLDIQGRELGLQFLSSVNWRIRIFKNLLPSFNTVHAASHIVPSAQQVSMQHILWIQTLQRIHLKRRFTATSVSGSILKTSKGCVLTVDEEEWFISSVYVNLKIFELKC